MQISTGAKFRVKGHHQGKIQRGLFEMIFIISGGWTSIFFTQAAPSLKKNSLICCQVAVLVTWKHDVSVHTVKPPDKRHSRKRTTSQ